jgi:glyoxalase superfamily protein
LIAGGLDGSGSVPGRWTARLLARAIGLREKPPGSRATGLTVRLIGRAAEWLAEVIGMVDGRGVPTLRQVVLDTTDTRALAEFYRELLGLVYRPGDEVPPDDWLVLRTPQGVPQLAFQQVAELAEPTWPDPAVPQQLHLDLTVGSVEELRTQHDRVLELGGRLLHDLIDDPDEPLRVYADPSGHPFCIFVA